MKYTKGFAGSGAVIAVIAVLVIGGGVAYYATKTKAPSIETSIVDDYQLTEQDYVPPTTNNTTSQQQTSSPTSTTNNTTSQQQTSASNNTQQTAVDSSSQVNNNNVTDQPAYLVKAYTQNNKNYIDVDYIELLSGSASLQAQVADGECPSVDDCYDFPNGYKRNQNPLIRTFEVNNNASITIGGLLFSKKFDIAYTASNNGGDYYINGDYYNDYVENQSNHNSTFSELKNLVSQVTSYLPYNPPFEKPITYIKIDIQDNMVTKIIEPYQE